LRRAKIKPKKKQIPNFVWNDKLFLREARALRANQNSKPKNQKQRQIPHVVRDDSLVAGCHFSA
jgi:hypothetical protein